MKKPRILLYDIETTPNLAYVWGKYEQDVIAYNQERELLCFAYQWVGETKVHCKTREGDSSDRELIRKLATLIEQADIIVAHNGDDFDRKILKARMLYHNMKPLKPNCSVDTKKVAKNYFKFNGNGLDDICKFLNIGRKAKGPGFEMWLGCINNNKRSWAQMKKYNKQDVVLLYRLYAKLRPWIENHPNVSRIMAPNYKHNICPNCSCHDVRRNGFRATTKVVNQVWKCNGCGRQWLTPWRKVQ